MYALSLVFVQCIVNALFAKAGRLTVFHEAKDSCSDFCQRNECVLQIFFASVIH